jgi:hypothetical protein
MIFRRRVLSALLVPVLFLAPARVVFGQLDQGTITGVVQDPTGAAIPNASVTLTNIDLGQVLKTTTDGSGVYVFSPIKIGEYSVSAGAPGFEITTQTNLHLSIQQRLNVVVTLKAGAATETVTVTTEVPLMQTQESSVGQTVSTQTINSVPLASRNWVYIAQLSAGTAVAAGSRGAGKGDFEANGQRAEENNFILDGVDNNANVVDFYNGASYVAQPPPDALAEFKVQTSNYSAEFGHSAGAVINASIKSGSNSLHGDAWEYLRNTAFDVHDWNPNGVQPVSPYHENQFGATLGGPVLKNKIFLFGDAQATRIRFNEPSTNTVPSLLERTGDFSDLLNSTFTGNPPVQLYHQTAGAPPVPFTNNCLVTSSTCTNTVGGVAVNAAALALLQDYPKPNAGNGLLANNYITQKPVLDDTFQWDVRADYTIGAKDTTYSRYSYWNEVGHVAPPLGNILDGGGFGDDGKQKTYGANFMWSETHVFTQTFTNEARFGFNYLHTGFQHPNASNLGFAASVGFGGIPTGVLNGGLPAVSLNSALTNFGSPTWSTTDEHQNIYQIIDNVTKIWGNHALKAGVVFENIRFSTLQPQNPRGNYNYNGNYTSDLTAAGATVANTGWGPADFLLDLQNSAGISNEVTNGDQRANNSAYVQDDWRFNQKLAVNLGVRWEYFQPYQDVGGYQASFNPIAGSLSFNSTTGKGTGKGQYLIPTETYNYALGIINSSSYSPNYGFELAADNITTVSTADPHLLKPQHANFAPRLGVSYSMDPKTVVRAGFGIFYGGLESLGYWPNLGENYPFQVTGNIQSVGNCTANICPNNGIGIGTGFTQIIAHGFASNVGTLTMRGADPNPKTPYTMSYNLAVERGITNDLVATVSYVGNGARHLQLNVDANAPLALAASGTDSQPFRPFSHAGGTASVVYTGMSQYNALQAKIEKRMSHGYNLLATYTWAHAIDDGNTPLGSTGDNGQQNYYLVPIRRDYSQSAFDTRQRVTFNALYQLPFGKGRAYLNSNAVADAIIGGWAANATFTAQSGNFFSVYPVSGFKNAAGNGNTRAVRIGDPFKGGGTSSVPGVTCATSVKNHNNWFNPCAFDNPWDSTTGANAIASGTYVTDTATALKYLGGRRNVIPGPGFDRLNMSIFKEFTVFHEQKLEFRTDAFNLLNTPALAAVPSNQNKGTQGGQINGTRSLQKYSPDSRFFQMALKYSF